MENTPSNDRLVVACKEEADKRLSLFRPSNTTEALAVARNVIAATLKTNHDLVRDLMTFFRKSGLMMPEELAERALSSLIAVPVYRSVPGQLADALEESISPGGSLFGIMGSTVLRPELMDDLCAYLRSQDAGLRGEPQKEHNLRMSRMTEQLFEVGRVNVPEDEPVIDEAGVGCGAGASRIKVSYCEVCDIPHPQIMHTICGNPSCPHKQRKVT